VCLVFGVSCLVFEHADIASSISYQTPNTKHQTLDEFDFL
jgi:hypothetical protein